MLYIDSEYRSLFMIPVGIIFFLGCFRSMIKKLIEVIKTKPDDLDIGAEIICVEPVSSGKKSRLLVRYNIEGRQKNYIYYSSRSPEEYIVGNEVILKLCQKNGLVYDKKFLIKELVFWFVLTVIGVLFTIYAVCDFLLEV